MNPKPIGELVEQWRDAAKSTTLQDVYSEESGPYFECATQLESLLREWDEYLAHVTTVSLPTTGIQQIIRHNIFGLKEPK
jgi:hypothetical protein